MVEKNKYCSKVMKKPFSKKLVMTKVDDEENSTKCWIFHNTCIDGNVKDHCHITGKYRGFVARDCNINVKLNNKFPTVFYNLENYDSHFIMEELDKFDFTINAIANVLKNT